MAYLMGIDLGTSSLKTMIIREDGEVVCVSAQNYQFASPYSGYAEHDPAEWWDACVATIRKDLADSGVDLTCYVYTKTAEDNYYALSEIRENLLARFGENGMSFAFPHVEVTGSLNQE